MIQSLRGRNGEKGDDQKKKKKRGGKVKGGKLEMVGARGGQVGVPICDSTQQEGRGGSRIGWLARLCDIVGQP